MSQFIKSKIIIKLLMAVYKSVTTCLNYYFMKKLRSCFEANYELPNHTLLLQLFFSEYHFEIYCILHMNSTSRLFFVFTDNNKFSLLTMRQRVNNREILDGIKFSPCSIYLVAISTIDFSFFNLKLLCNE